MIRRAYCGAQLLSGAFTLLLAACGGGGGSGSGGSNAALSVSTTSITFTAIQNGATPSTQNVAVTISGGTVYVAINSVTGTGFSPSFSITGQTSGNIVITPFPPSLAPGTYTGTVTVRGCADASCSSGDVAGSPEVINVSYTIQPLTGLAASPQSLSFGQLQGGPAPAAQILGISEISGGSYAWNASVTYQSGSGWLNINGASSASGTSLPALLSLSGSSSSTLGTLNAIVHITGNGKAIDVPVSYTVSQPQISASLPGLNFNTVNLGPVQPTQNLTLTTQGSVPVIYATSVTYAAGATGWLTVPASGTAPGPLSVSVNTNTLTPGRYQATIILTTATQMVSLSITNDVQPSSLIVPGLLGFTISPASTASALILNLNVESSGAPLTWTATVSVPWMTVSPTTGTTPTPVTLSLVPAQVDALDNGFRRGPLTFSYTPPNGTLTIHQQMVDFELLLPTVASVIPYVAASGTTKEVILRGDQLNITAGLPVLFGTTQISTHTIVSDTEIRVTHPPLTANSYPVSIANRLNNPGIVRSRANLVVVDAPTYATTTLAYPNTTTKQPLNLAYDAERQALIVGVAYPSAGQSGDIFRYTFSGSAWSAVPAILGVSAFRDLALSLDGKNLIAVSDLRISQLDAVTLAAGTSTSAPPNSTPFFLSGLALANDGNALITAGVNGSGFSDAYRYSIRDGLFSPPVGNLSFATAAASADGSRVVFVQSGVTPAQNVYQYLASDTSLAPVNLPLNRLLAGPALDRQANRIVLNGNLVYDANYQFLGRIPASSAVVLSPDGSRVYAYSNGTMMRAYNLAVSPVAGVFPEIGTGTTTLPSDPGATPVMTVSPDGGTLFIAGSDGIVVVPAP